MGGFWACARETGALLSADDDLACHLGMKFAEVGVFACVFESERELLIGIENGRREFLLRAFHVVRNVVAVHPCYRCSGLDRYGRGIEGKVIDLDFCLPTTAGC